MGYELEEMLRDAAADADRMRAELAEAKAQLAERTRERDDARARANQTEARTAAQGEGGVMVAALYIDPRGPYPAMADVDAWDEKRDARPPPAASPPTPTPPRCARSPALSPPEAAERYALDDTLDSSELDRALRRWREVKP